jgi:hypothetical protein
MIRLTNILAEIKVNDPGQQILFGLNDGDYFTSLIKIIGYKTQKEVIEKMNKLYGLNKEDGFSSTNEQPLTLNNPAYAYIFDDGIMNIEFTNSLNAFPPDYRTEEEWGVAEWSTKAPK